MRQRNALFISMHLPSPRVPQAGQKIAFCRLRDLAAQYNVHLVSFVNEAEEPFADVEPISFCSSIKLIRLTRWKRLVNAMRNPHLPLRVAVRRSRELQEAVGEIVGRVPIDQIVAEFSQSIEFVPSEYLQGRVRLNVHDVLSQVWDRYALNTVGIRKLAFLAAAGHHRNWERNTYRKIPEITVLSYKDADLLKALGCRSEAIRVELPAVDNKFQHLAETRGVPAYPPTVLFWGAMSRRENDDAVKWFVDEIWPAIIRVRDDVKLIIAGADPSQRILALSNQRIDVTGFVSDPLPLFERAWVSIAPLREGAGVKIKVLEALASGLTVVGTPVAAEGIEHRQLHVEDAPQRFASAVLRVISDIESCH